jgi:hypothetical protein
MFNFRPPTGVPGFRVGLEEEVPGFNIGPDGSVRSTGSPDAPPYGYYPYGDVTPTSVDPRGAGTDPPGFSPVPAMARAPQIGDGAKTQFGARTGATPIPASRAAAVLSVACLA